LTGTLLRGGRVFDDTGAPPGEADVVVEDGRILVDGPEAMRRKVRELVRAGADVIKVATSGGVLSPTDDPRHAHFRDDELTALGDRIAAVVKDGRLVAGRL
jgi:hypothetical protein